MKIEDIKEDMSVLYIPGHAHGDRTHPDCERGIVSSKNAVNVFVRYYHNGVLREAWSTSPEDLVL